LEIVDGYAKTVSGVGFMGESVPVNDRLHELWHNMISRCYNPTHPSYKFYGERGVTVSPVWHSFEHFARTISKVPGYHKLVQGEKLALDKDYFGSKVYSPSTCVFLPASYNTNSISEDGCALQIEGELYATYTDWAGDKKTAHYAKSRWDAGLPYKGIPASSVTRVAPDAGHLWRKRVFFDQFADLMKQIKNDPFSRRHIVDAWNAPALPDQALPPCHAMIQFYVTPDADGNPHKLSCQLYQRSADMFLGVPFNIASYAILTHMVAQQVGLEVGEFVHSFGDCHIYSNHFEQVEEQLSREAREYPQLVIKRKPASVFDYELGDFEIVGYDPHPTIRAAVSV
jgi:thymidylate synthase